jgi:uncharacterized protein (DUF305 family)
MPYGRFALTLALSLLAMFVISLEQVRSVDHFYLNLSNFFITLTGVGAMGLIMLTTMRGMFTDSRKTAITAAVLGLLLVGGFALARTEAFVGDRAFLESMIPHHSRALLVCQESQLSDAEIVELCRGIVDSQTREIRQMEDILSRY